MSKILSNIIKRQLHTTCINNKLKILHDYVHKNRMESWQIHSFGDISELQLTKTRMPMVTHSEELLIKVNAASLNHIDLMMMNGYARNLSTFFRQDDLELPLTLGRDFCGTVIDKGQAVGNAINVGDEVYGVIPFYQTGSLAEAVAIDKSLVRLKPEFLTNVEAAGIFYAGLTAWSALFLTGELCFKDPKKMKVLILGASGGVGTFAIQFLRARNIDVSATCSRDAETLVQSLGPSRVFDYSAENYIKNITSVGTYDVVLDCAWIGGSNLPPGLKYKKYISLNSPFVQNTDKYGIIGGFIASAGNLISTNLQKFGEGKSERWAFFAPFASGIDFIDELIKNKKVSPVVQQVYKFDQVPEAFQRLSSGHLRGKIVIDFETHV